MNTIKLICQECKKEFTIPKYRFRNGRRKYCSKKCKYIAEGKQKKTSIKCICFICKKEFYRKPSHIKKKQYCSKKCWYIDKLGKSTWNKNTKGICKSNSGSFKKGQYAGEKHPNWKGGILIDKSSYILIYYPSHPFSTKHGYIRKHRLVVEKIIKRYLLPTEPVHHRGKKTDNRPRMLMAFVSHSAHIKFERTQHTNPPDIIFDGRKLLNN